MAGSDSSNQSWCFLVEYPTVSTVTSWRTDFRWTHFSSGPLSLTSTSFSSSLFWKSLYYYLLYTIMYNINDTMHALYGHAVEACLTSMKGGQYYTGHIPSFHLGLHFIASKILFRESISLIRSTK